MLKDIYIMQCNIQSFILAHNWQLVIVLLTNRFNFKYPFFKSVWCFSKCFFHRQRKLHHGKISSWIIHRILLVMVCVTSRPERDIPFDGKYTCKQYLIYTVLLCLLVFCKQWMSCSFAHIRQGNVIGTGNSWWYKTTERQTTYSKLFSFVICIMLCQINLSAYVELWYHSHYYCRMHQRYLLYIIGRTRTF